MPIGSTSFTFPRHDIAAYLGPSYLLSGYSSPCATLPPGGYTLAVFAHRRGFTAYTPYTTRITVHPAVPLITIENPKPDALVTQRFGVGGWALEQSTCSGTGVGCDPRLGLSGRRIHTDFSRQSDAVFPAF